MKTTKQPLFGVNKIEGDGFPFNSPTACLETILRLYDLDPPREGR